MKFQIIKNITVASLVISGLLGCSKNIEVDGNTVDAVYITSTAVTGTGTGASTTITNSASGKIAQGLATARVYVNTPKSTDVTINYTLGGTAVAGTNYTIPAPQSVNIPAGKWYADIQIPLINAVLPANRTIIITLASGNGVQLGLGTDRNYKVFTYTLTN